MHEEILIKNLNSGWDIRWRYDPLTTQLRTVYPDQWVRFHTLPNSKRYPENESEYETILNRYNTLLGELDPKESIIILTTQWSNVGKDPRMNKIEIDPEAVLWKTILENPEEDDAEFLRYSYIYASQRNWHPKAMDTILRAVADDKMAGVYLMPTDMRWLYCPYDGGVDIVCNNQKQRDELKAKYKNWLSSHPEGL